MAQILDGKTLCNTIAERLKTAIESHGSTYRRPGLAIIQVGDNKESTAYIEGKKKFGTSVGIETRHIHLSEHVSELDVVGEIQKLNSDDAIDGIIVQLPLPKALTQDVSTLDRIIESIDPRKDVDGLTSASIKGLWMNDKSTFMPATTRGILTMLDYYGVSIPGKNVVIIGRSRLVGKPTALAFLNLGATVTVCHSETKNLEYHTTSADILITAVGQPRLITESHVRPGQYVIDVGITIEEIAEKDPLKKKLSGDVELEYVSRIVKAISPVPGGVGPMTRASLFENTYDAYVKNIVL